MKWPFTKKQKKRAYEGAKNDRLVAGWVTSNTSADSEILSSLTALRNRSRQLVRDNDWARAVIRSITDNVIGRGIPFQAQIKMARGSKIDQVKNDAIEMAWCEWSNKKYCDTSGRLSMQDIERLVIRNVLESGEVFVRKVRKNFGGSKVPLAIQIIEADLLDEQYNGRSIFGNEIRMGIEVDEWNRPVAYHFFAKHPGDINLVGLAETRGRRVRVLADEIEHIYLPERAHQSRGVPILASSMTRIHHLGGMEQSEVVAARAGASLMGFIETPEGEIQGDATVGDQRVTNFEPGEIRHLNSGEKIVVPQINRPGNQFEPFMRAMLRGVAAGTGVSYESVSKDFSQSNYSSTRQSLLEERNFYRVLQDWIVRNFHQKIFEEWMQLAVMAGALPFKDYLLSPEKYHVIKWMPRGWAWIDPSKEVEANKAAVRAGFKTLSEVISEAGGDFDETVAQRVRELKTLDENELVLDTDPAMIDDKGAIQSVNNVVSQEETAEPTDAAATQ